MDSVWKDIEAVVEEEDEKEYDERQDTKLNGSTNLPSSWLSPLQETS